jgi:hypothetical protein
LGSDYEEFHDIKHLSELPPGLTKETTEDGTKVLRDEGGTWVPLGRFVQMPDPLYVFEPDKE